VYNFIVTAKFLGLIVLIVVVVAALIGVAKLVATHSNTIAFSSRGVSFNYPAAYEDQTFSAPDGVLALFKRSAPDSTITVVHDSGADLGTLLTKANVLDDLESSIAKSLPSKYPGYQKDQSSRQKIAGYESLINDFHYTSTDGSTKYARLAIVPRDHDAYYITTESTSKSVVQSDSDVVCNSLKLP
jgi:hypothetical protein